MARPQTRHGCSSCTDCIACLATSLLWGHTPKLPIQCCRRNRPETNNPRIHDFGQRGTCLSRMIPQRGTQCTNRTLRLGWASTHAFDTAHDPRKSCRECTVGRCSRHQDKNRGSQTSRLEHNLYTARTLCSRALHCTFPADNLRTSCPPCPSCLACRADMLRTRW